MLHLYMTCPFLTKKESTPKNTDGFFDLKKVSFSDLYLGVGCCCLVVRSNQTELYKVESEPSERTITLNSSIWLYLDYAVWEKNSVPAPMLLYQFLNTFFFVFFLRLKAALTCLQCWKKTLFSPIPTRVNKWPWASEKSIQSASANACLLGC